MKPRTIAIIIVILAGGILAYVNNKNAEPKRPALWQYLFLRP